MSDNEPLWRFRSSSMRPVDIAREFLREAFEEPRTMCDFGGAMDVQGCGRWCFGTQEGNATYLLTVDVSGSWEVRVHERA
jgi:hypothetical protein